MDVQILYRVRRHLPQTPLFTIFPENKTLKIGILFSRPNFAKTGNITPKRNVMFGFIGLINNQHQTHQLCD